MTTDEVFKRSAIAFAVTDEIYQPGGENKSTESRDKTKIHGKLQCRRSLRGETGGNMKLLRYRARQYQAPAAPNYEANQTAG